MAHGECERIRFKRSARLLGVEVLDATACSHVWKVFHERYAITACESVSATMRYRGRTTQLQDGSVVFFEPGEIHVNTAVPRPQNFKVLFIEPRTLGQAAEELGVSGPIHFREVEAKDPLLFSAIGRLSAALDDADAELDQQSWFATCASIIIRRGEKGPLVSDTPGLVTRAKAYVLQHYHERITLDELAAAVGVSRFHLAHTFARAVGISPHAYQVHVRIQRATMLLRSGQLAVEAAAQVGFADQSHFARYFKRIWGLTPAAYAAGNR